MNKSLPHSQAVIAQQPSRDQWVDAIRGFGILLVTIGHTWRGLESSGLIPDFGLFQAVDMRIYAFHMPLFFLVSGFYLPRVLGARTWTRFATSRIERLLWPLLVWTYVFFLFRIAAGSLANTQSNWSSFPWFPLPPREQFWFLWALFLVQMSALAIKPWLGHGRHKSTILWLLMLSLSLALYYFPIGLEGNGEWLSGAYQNAPYLFLGAFIGSMGLPIASNKSGAIGLVLFVFLIASVPVLSAGPTSRLFLASSLSLLCCVAVQFLHPKIGWAGSLFVFLGETSLAIFVAHVIFSAATRIVLIKVGVEDIWLHMIAGTLLGMLGPICLYLLARRLGVTRLVGF